LLLQDKGWSRPEEWGTWSVGPRANMVPIPIQREAENSDFLLEAKVRAFVPKPGQAQNITVRANGVTVANWTLSGTEPEHDVTARISNAVMVGHSALALSFDISNPASPASVGLSPDTRELGMGLIALKLKELVQ
jgi:arabinofuranosyltransferase